jgi:hypothetical protein
VILEFLVVCKPLKLILVRFNSLDLDSFLDQVAVSWDVEMVRHELGEVGVDRGLLMPC